MQAALMELNNCHIEKLFYSHKNETRHQTARIITESSPYLLGYFRKCVLIIVFELSSKYLPPKKIYIS